MKVQAYKTRVFREQENLLDFIIQHIPKIPDQSVLVITSKIVSLAEGRTRILESSKAREKLIKAESQLAIRTKYVWLTIKDNMVMASAGIDESNANGKIILLPKNSFTSAEKIRKQLQKYFKVKNLGIIISDSRTMPLRAGIVGVALGYSGFAGVRDYRGKGDIFGRVLKFSRTDVADSLATSAVLLMGEGAEQQPLAVITQAPIEFRERINRHELEIDIKEDLYQPLFEKIKN